MIKAKSHSLECSRKSFLLRECSAIILTKVTKSQNISPLSIFALLQNRQASKAEKNYSSTHPTSGLLQHPRHCNSPNTSPLFFAGTRKSKKKMKKEKEQTKNAEQTIIATACQDRGKPLGIVDNSVKVNRNQRVLTWILLLRWLTGHSEVLESGISPVVAVRVLTFS